MQAKASVDVLVERFISHERRTMHLEHTVYGNGQTGIHDIALQNNREIEDMKEEARERRADARQIKMLVVTQMLALLVGLILMLIRG